MIHRRFRRLLITGQGVRVAGEPAAFPLFVHLPEPERRFRMTLCDCLFQFFHGVFVIAVLYQFFRFGKFRFAGNSGLLFPFQNDSVDGFRLQFRDLDNGFLAAGDSPSQCVCFERSKRDILFQRLPDPEQIDGDIVFDFRCDFQRGILFRKKHFSRAFRLIRRNFQSLYHRTDSRSL